MAAFLSSTPGWVNDNKKTVQNIVQNSINWGPGQAIIFVGVPSNFMLFLALVLLALTSSVNVRAAVVPAHSIRETSAIGDVQGPSIHDLCGGDVDITSNLNNSPALRADTSETPFSDM